MFIERVFMSYKVLTAFAIASLSAAAQINVIGVTPTATQAILQYDSPVISACGLKVADMNRSITVASSTSQMAKSLLQPWLTTDF